MNTTTIKTATFLLLPLFFLLPPPSTPAIIYVTPTPPIPCPDQPCHNLSYYAKETTEFLTSNTTMIFLPGEHTYKVRISIANISNFSMIGEARNTSTVICSGTDCDGFYFEAVSQLLIHGLTFVSDSHSINAVNVDEFLLTNCTLANSSNTVIAAIDSSLLLEGNTFVNNSGHGDKQAHFSPGGGISITSSNLTLQGLNVFLNNTCSNGHCGGNAIYSLNSRVTIEGVANFVNNSVMDSLDTDVPSGGGGVLLLSTTIDISGHVNFTNNRISNAYVQENKCEIAGGGASLILCNATISGEVIFFNNLANGKASCGGGLFVAGGSITVTGTVGFTDNQAGYYGGGILNEGGNIVIVGVLLFVNNSAGRSGGGLAMLGGKVDISSTGSILSNDSYAGYDGGGIDIEQGNLNVSGVLSLSGNLAGNFGGGINILRTSVDTTGFMSISNNHVAGGCAEGGSQGGGWNMQDSTINVGGRVAILNNSAKCAGGGLAIDVSSVSVTGYISVTNNSAGSDQSSGGGILIGSSNVTISNVSVIDNHAYQGGGIVSEGSNVIVTETATITGNSASYIGGGATINKSSFNMSGTVQVANNSAKVLGGGIVMQNCTMSITGHALFFGNCAGFAEGSDGGGMVLRVESTVTVIGTMLLHNNWANHSGGGMLLDSTSILAIAGKVNFTGNQAGQLGGAIFVEDENRLVYCASEISGAECVVEECFFRNLSNSHDTLMVFDSNNAQTGSLLYGGSVDRCTLDGRLVTGDVFDAIADYSKQPDANSLISSYPYRACLCESNKPHCGKVTDITAYPGETFYFPAVTVGQREGMVTQMVINAIANPSGLARLGVFEDRQVATNCTELHYTLFSDPSDVVLEMYVSGTCSSLEGSQNTLYITIHLRPCPPAFELSEAPYGCICEERLQKYTNSCNINGQTIMRDEDFWVGYDNHSQSPGLILHPHCPFNYCKAKPINFTLNDIDLQCAHNRTGLLCGACSPGLSLAIGSSRCLPCTNVYLSLLLPFAVMGVALMFFLLVFKVFTVRHGMIGGLIFYASIVGANQNIFFPPGKKNFLDVSISWCKLDLGIETCFYDGMDTYTKTWLQFVFPMYLFGLITLVILFKKRYPHIAEKIRLNGEHPQAVLATFFILSYGKIVHTIIAVFSYTTLFYPNGETELVWLYDANIKYLHGKHIPLFAVSVIFSLIVILPFTILLLFGQLLEKLPASCTWIKDPLMEILSVYHTPFNAEHHYWPGLLLVVRLALFILFGVNALQDYGENLLLISAAAFGLLAWPWMARGQVYRDDYKWFGVLEATHLLNLGVFASATFYVQQSGRNQAIVAYISTGAAFVSFIVTLIYHIYRQRGQIKDGVYFLLRPIMTSQCRMCSKPSEENRSLLNVSTSVNVQ